jgi:predicted dehydrogenase
MRYQGSVIGDKARAHGDIVAICDVDRNIREQARAAFGSTPAIYEDYRDMLARSDVDVVTIGTPDHWHTKMLIDACRAGKDVYCEKPLTLTIDEGKIIRRVVTETSRVVQVGSWQRSDQRFRLAVEMVRQGRIGQLQRVDIALNKNEAGGPFAASSPPPSLNWNLWQGQTPSVPFIPERCHYTFRWWHEYSGGQMTDWGAHHIDIAQWAIGEHPVEIEATAKFPHIKNGYNVAIDFSATYRYANGVVMTVADTGRNGIAFTGTEGRIFVNRGTLAGKPVDDLAHRPLPRESFTLYDFDNLERPARSSKLDSIINHMGNFFDCVRSRRQPLSDVESQHRSATTCHLGNIAMRLGRRLRWDAKAEVFLDDSPANSHLRRPQRAGFEIA